jgi:hypothetical protein
MMHLGQKNWTNSSSTIAGKPFLFVSGQSSPPSLSSIPTSLDLTEHSIESLVRF